MTAEEELFQLKKKIRQAFEYGYYLNNQLVVPDDFTASLYLLVLGEIRCKHEETHGNRCIICWEKLT
jgi:hypothetical protein